MPQTQTDGPRQGYLTINEFAKLVGVHPQTIRSWDKSGILAPHHRTPGGQRRYSQDQVKQILDSQIEPAPAEKGDGNG